jgi:hypothetical protein
MEFACIFFHVMKYSNELLYFRLEGKSRRRKEIDVFVKPKHSIFKVFQTKAEKSLLEEKSVNSLMWLKTRYIEYNW